jgi:DNA (cytosine-5)-methyltransferase 1
MSSTDIKALSLFSGAGGDTLGMENTGVQVVGFVEWEKPMIQTHLANFPNSKLIERDVRNVTSEQLQEYVGNTGIIFAGFPCQGFSKGGKKDPKDDRNNLFKEFVRITNIVKPNWIIGENVKHITKMKTPDDRDVPVVIKEAFEAIGYVMEEPYVLKAELFGIPQKRERCFFLGRRSDYCTTSEHPFMWTNVNAAGRSIPKTRLKHVLEHSLENAMEITDEDAAAYGIARWIVAPEALALTPTGTPPLNLRKCHEKKLLSFGKRISPHHSEIVDPEGCAKTLICSYNRMPRMFVAVQCDGVKYLRPFTINEAKQIQGFPANYIITGTAMDAIKQIGNAVPPPLIKVICNELLKV